MSHSLLKANNFLQSPGLGLSTMKTSISLSQIRTILGSSESLMFDSAISVLDFVVESFGTAVVSPTTASTVKLDGCDLCEVNLRPVKLGFRVYLNRYSKRHL